MSKVLLIYPIVNADVPVKSILLGLGYLASALRNNGHEVKIVDWVKGITNYGDIEPDFIGVSAMFTDNRLGTQDTINIAKQTFPNAHFIVGGAHASLFSDEMIKMCDTVVVGEGEEVINDIVENKRKGIIYAPRINDLDKLAMPAWDLMFKDVLQINKASQEQPFIMRRPFVHILTSRGCPNECTFCAIKTIWGREWKARSAKNVVDEIQYLKDTYGFREIAIVEDNFSIDKNRVHKICDEIIERKLNLKFSLPTGTQIKGLDLHILRKMKQAGFYRLCFGIETGSQEMQEIIKKRINLEHAKKVIKWANDLGFWTSATFILGFPEETEKQQNDTKLFAKTSNLDFPIYYHLRPQLKTELERAHKDHWFILPTLSYIYKDFIKYKIKSIQTYINLTRKIKSWEDFKYLIGLIKVPLKMLIRRRLHNEGIRGR